AEQLLDLRADVQREGVAGIVLDDLIDVRGHHGDVFDQRTEPLLAQEGGEGADRDLVARHARGPGLPTRCRFLHVDRPVASWTSDAGPGDQEPAPSVYRPRLRRP